MTTARVIETPLRFVHFSGAAIAVAEEEHRAAAVTVRAALWMVQHWGLVSVEAVAERARALAPHWGASASIASRLLAAAPSTRWLDGPDRRWFSLTAPTSQLEITVRKVLSVATSLRIEDLRDGLTKAVPAVAVAPYGVLEQYLQQIVGCTVDGATVLAPTGLAVARAVLSPAEAKLARILEAAGGAIEEPILRRRALAAQLPEATTRRLLKISPLFLTAPGGLVRLIGRSSEATLTSRKASNVTAPSAAASSLS